MQIKNGFGRIKDSVLGRWRAFRRLPRRTQWALVSLAVGMVMLVIPLVTYAYFARDINDPERLMNRNRTGIVLLDRHGEVFYSYGRINHQDNIGLDKISDNLEQALIASEDKEFYNHQGYSLRGTLMALYANVLNKDLTKYGGSTITQQLVKNTLLSNDKNFLRKYQEVSIAIAVDRQYSKDEILAMYLNSVYFGEGAFGISQAAEVYFDKPAQDLTLAESSMLVGLLPAPSTYSPISGDKTKAKEQQDRVLSHMIEAGYINDEEKKQAGQTELSYASGGGETPEHAQHFATMVLDELKERYGEEKVIRSGYQVTTGLDLGWQKAAEQQVQERVAELSAQGGTNAGLVAIDPKSGQIRALVGSTDWNNTDFGKVNMALANRQPGSSFKPIYYAEALDKKLITPATILKDVPVTFADGYEPLNYDFQYRGDITVRRSLALSLNIPAVEVIQKVGPKDASAAAQRMGISTITEPEKYGLTLALGTAEAKLLEMTNAYAALANQGTHFTPATIVSIKDKFDKTVRQDKPKNKRVIGAEASFLISSILSDYEARQPTFGYSLSLADGRPAAVKTGTTDDNRDAWTIGYTPSLSVGVWVGNNANQPMSGVAGSSGAAPVWRNSMQQFLADTSAENFEQPPGVVSAFICSANGLRADSNFAGTYMEYFIAGTPPTESCSQPPPPREEPRKKEEDDEQEENKKEEREEERRDREEPEPEETIPPEEEPGPGDEPPLDEEEPTPGDEPPLDEGD